MHRELNKLEAAKTTELMKYIKFHKELFMNDAIEVKAPRDGKFYFKSGSFQKEIGCMTLASDRMCYKFPDAGLGSPYDITVVSKQKTHVVIFFGDVKKFYFIELRRILIEMADGKKSINEERAGELAWLIDCIK